MRLRNMSNLSQRIIVGAFSTFVMFFSIYLSFDNDFRPFFVLMIAGIIGTALSEFYNIARHKGYHPPVSLAIICSTLFVIATYLSTQYIALQHLPQAIFIFTVMAIFAYFFIRGKHPIPTIGITLFGLAYVTLTLSHIISINYFFPENSTQDGRLWLSYILIVTKMTDIGAFFCGKGFGQHKITPYISPSKTLEGAIGGFLTAIVASILFCKITSVIFPNPLSLTFGQSICLGALIGIVAQFGDLTESLLKRDANVKDSNQLPGLGGILDIADSLLFTPPLLYYFLTFYQYPFR